VNVHRFLYTFSFFSENPSPSRFFFFLDSVGFFRFHFPPVYPVDLSASFSFSSLGNDACDSFPSPPFDGVFLLTFFFPPPFFSPFQFLPLLPFRRFFFFFFCPPSLTSCTLPLPQFGLFPRVFSIKPSGGFLAPRFFPPNAFIFGVTFFVSLFFDGSM